MKSFLAFFESLRMLFIRSNPHTRTAMVFCTALLAVGLGLLAQNANLFSSRMEYLLDGQDFTAEQLDQFELAFSTAGLRWYERTGNRMRIPTASRDAYLKALAQAKCLTSTTNIEQELQTASLPLLESRAVTERRERLQRIKRVQDTLTEFPFVRQAIVTYDEKTEGFAAERKRSATVAIHPRTTVDLSRSQRRNVIRLVLKSFPGLKASEVVLVDLRKGETYSESNLELDANERSAETGAATGTEYTRQREEEIKRKALALLAGYGDVSVVVNCELANPNDPQSAVEPRGLEGAGVSSGRDQSAPPRSALEAATDPESANKLPSPSLVANRKVSLGESQAPPKTFSNLTTNVSVSIPTSYYRRAYLHRWELAHPGESAVPAPPMDSGSLQEVKLETMRSVQEKLSPLVENPSRISVTDHLDANATVAAENYFSVTSVLDWLADSWKMIGLMATVLVALLCLRSVAKPPVLASHETLSRDRSDRRSDASDFEEENFEEKGALERDKFGSDLMDRVILESPESAGGGEFSGRSDFSPLAEEKPSMISQMTSPAVPRELPKVLERVQTEPGRVASRLASWISRN